MIKQTQILRFDLSSGSIYLPYWGSDVTLRDQDGNSLEVRGITEQAIMDAIVDNIRSRKWAADDDARKAVVIAFAEKVQAVAAGLIRELAPGPGAGVDG